MITFEHLTNFNIIRAAVKAVVDVVLELRLNFFHFSKTIFKLFRNKCTLYQT